MHRALAGPGFAGFLVLAAACLALTAPLSGQEPLRPLPDAVNAVPLDLVERVRADPFSYFRFINRAWTTRVCAAFADVTNPMIVRLHGDAHVEQFALTKDEWGLTDFDDSTRGPAFVDIVRFLGSVDLATRQRGWTRSRDAIWDRFFDGYRRGLTNPAYRPAMPGIVQALRNHAPVSRAAYLAWGENLMLPMDKARLTEAAAGMEAVERLVRPERPDLATGYFRIVRAGWLRTGVGSAASRKMLLRVQGPTSKPDDDELIEVKEVVSLGGVRCLEQTSARQAARVILGNRQLGRLKHAILAVGPTLLVSPSAGGAEPWLDWWVASWEPSYREVRLSDLRSVQDLADVTFDASVQLASGTLIADRQQALAALAAFEPRLRRETLTIVEALLAGWRELGGR